MTPLNLRYQTEKEPVAGESASLTIMVTAGGNRVEGVDIAVDTESAGHVEYDGEGNPVVVIDEAQPGLIKITASKDGFEDGEVTIEVPEPEEPEPILPEIPEPDETPEEPPEEPSSTPICDNLFFGGQMGLSKTQATIDAIKAEIYDLEASADPLAEDKIAAGRKAILLLEDYLQEVAERDAEIAAANAKANDADAKANDADAKADEAIAKADEAKKGLEKVLAAVKARKGGVYFV